MTNGVQPLGVDIFGVDQEIIGVVEAIGQTDPVAALELAAALLAVGTIGVALYRFLDRRLRGRADAKRTTSFAATLENVVNGARANDPWGWGRVLATRLKIGFWSKEYMDYEDGTIRLPNAYQQSRIPLATLETYFVHACTPQTKGVVGKSVGGLLDHMHLKSFVDEALPSYAGMLQAGGGRPKKNPQRKLSDYRAQIELYGMQRWWMLEAGDLEVETTSRQFDEATFRTKLPAVMRQFASGRNGTDDRITGFRMHILGDESVDTVESTAKVVETELNSDYKVYLSVIAADELPILAPLQQSDVWSYSRDVRSQEIKHGKRLHQLSFVPNPRLLLPGAASP